VAIGILVSFHELGHFWAARRLGVKVLRFSVGFGKPLWRRRGRDGVEYVLASIPLGGYVKLLDEREGPVPGAELARAFNRQPVASRIAIFAAGPVFNFVLAMALYWIMFMVGVPGMKPVLAEPAANTAAAAAGLHEGDRVLTLNGQSIPTWTQLRPELLSEALRGANLSLGIQDRSGQQRLAQLDLSRVRIDPEFLFDDLGLAPYQPAIDPVLSEVVPGGAADQAGFKAGDRLVAYNGHRLSSFQEWAQYVAAHPGEVVRLDVERGGRSLQLSVLLATDKQDGRVRGRFGAGAQRMAKDAQMWQDLWVVTRAGPVTAAQQALQQTWEMTALVGRVMGRMVSGDISVKNLSGPISTAQAAGFAASAGAAAFLGFLAFVSLNLGFVNLLPIPVLDGGQIVSCLVEAIKGAPLSERAQALVQQLGFGLLILIMGFAFYNDIARQIG
jgi:regulator of sigma E protease